MSNGGTMCGNTPGTGFEALANMTPTPLDSQQIASLQQQKLKNYMAQIQQYQNQNAAAYAAALAGQISHPQAVNSINMRIPTNGNGAGSAKEQSPVYVQLPSRLAIFIGTMRIFGRWLGARFRLYCEHGQHWAVFRSLRRMHREGVAQGYKGWREVWCTGCITKYVLTEGSDRVRTEKV